MDPRLRQRRRGVLEGQARSRFRFVIGALVSLTAAGALAWWLQSPFAALEEVELIGVEQSNAVEVITELQVVPGRPIVAIRLGQLRRTLLEDPWIAEAQVERDFPHRLLVTVEERDPSAWIRSSEGWTLYSGDGYRLTEAPTLPTSAPIVQFGVADPIEPHPDANVMAALEFMSAIPSDVADGAIIRQAAGELWLELPSFRVRLGRAVEMTTKALVLTAMLEDPPPHGSVINLIAPDRPAVKSG